MESWRNGPLNPLKSYGSWLAQWLVDGDGCLHVGRPRLPHAASVDRAVPGTAAEVSEASSKLSPKDAVHDEVDGRVGGDDYIAEVVVVVVW